jgi:uncharacterized protein YqhQ
MMENQFTSVMTQRTDAELLKIVNEQKNDYQPKAIEAAELEIKKRNMSSERIQEAIQENKTKNQIETEKTNKELDSGLKVLTFIFPGIIMIIFAGIYKSDGYDRKSKELTKWTLYGFCFYIGLAILMMILNRI